MRLERRGAREQREVREVQGVTVLQRRSIDSAVIGIEPEFALFYKSDDTG